MASSPKIVWRAQTAAPTSLVRAPVKSSSPCSGVLESPRAIKTTAVMLAALARR
eukprot:CAMPEP_0194380566 /NCGR_PEP_ID=MMETSP0174-20130528/45934_1 /TAXON_ID=216777 /ORGANISM="Proboscia alata, Strain PI-D3" /LENGTH=53 /DNA_ID=CAMNT_0039164053 /DNA_START=46 /DNA_END=203 /DNA_ORIENTATION=-